MVRADLRPKSIVAKEKRPVPPAGRSCASLQAPPFAEGNADPTPQMGLPSPSDGVASVDGAGLIIVRPSLTKGGIMATSQVIVQLEDVTNSCFVAMPFLPLYDAEYQQVIKPRSGRGGLGLCAGR
jgi:hypothetical protein